MYSTYYKVGGKLRYNHPTYVERKCDTELLELLQSGEYCLVLNSRQMGKSSLQARTMKKLETTGIKCAAIDLTLLGLGNETKSEIIIKGFADELISRLDLDLEFNLKNWWSEYQHLSLIQRLHKLIESVVLAKITQKIIIFIDEIDSLLNLPNKDYFFAFIRACYNKRADNEAYDRLCFCLLGVMSPTNLVQDKQRTPFNIGKVIQLTGVTFTEAKDALIPGLTAAIDNPEVTLKEIIYWTGGQPFLTQKLCTLTVEHAQQRKANISEIVSNYIIEGWENQDVPEHLRTIRDRLIHDETQTIQLLGLYQQILTGSEVVPDRSEAQTQLRLSGLVVKKDNKLKVYNPIYQAIFNADWVKENLDNLRPYSEAINSWIKSNRDEQFLLQGTSLTTAWQWAKSRKLGNIDYDFLSASQKFQSDKERQAKDILVAAYAEEQAAKKKAEQNINKGKIILGVTILLASIISCLSILFVREQIKMAKVAELNKSAIEAEQAFDTGQELESLLTAMTTVKQLKQQVGNKNIAKYPTTEPLHVLNKILNNIQEKNQIKLNAEGISSLTFSPDSLTIIAGGNDGTVKLWNTQDNEIKILNKLPGEITNTIVSSRDKTLLFADNQGAIQISDSEGNLINILEAENVTSFNLSPDEKYIVAGDNQGNLTLWTKDGKLIKTWTAHQGNITSIAFSPNGKIIASSSNDTSIALSTIAGEKTATLTKHRGMVNSVAFSPDGKILASGSAENTIKLWTADGKFIKDITVNSSSVNSVAFSPDGKTLISGNSDKTIKLWNINPDSLKETGTLRETLIGHQNIVTSVIYSPDGKSIISGDKDGIVKLWHSPSQKTQRIEVGILSKDGNTLISSKPLANITFQSLDGEIIKTLPPPKNTIITSIAFSPSSALVGTIDGRIAQSDLLPNTEATWHFLTQVNNQVEDGYYQGEVIDLDFHPSGDGFVSVGIERQNTPDEKLFAIKLWDKQGNLQKTVNPGDKQAITALTFMPQGDEFIVARTNGEIELWQSDGITKKIVARNTSKNIKENLTSLAISSDGNILATASSDGTIQVRKLDGTLLLNFGSQISKLKNIYFSQDERTILVIKSNGEISAWTMDLEALLQRGCQWLQDYSRNATDFPQELCLFDS